MSVERACLALEKGCRLELHYTGWCRVVEVHAVGFDAGERPVIQAFLPANGSPRDESGWMLLPLDETRRASVSGYFSEAPRMGFELDPRIARLVCKVDAAEPSPYPSPVFAAE